MQLSSLSAEGCASAACVWPAHTLNLVLLQMTRLKMSSNSSFTTMNKKRLYRKLTEAGVKSENEGSFPSV